MINGWLPLLNLAIQLLLFVWVIKYTNETRRIRRNSQEQVEAAHKPCVTFAASPREPVDAILDMHNAVGAMEVQFLDGNAQLESTGTGPAINIHFNMTPTNPESTRARPSGYFLWMKAGSRFPTPIPRGIFAANEWECIITYESLSQRHYRTKIIINNLVLTAIEFGPIET
jgi:hypothetical protein